MKRTHLLVAFLWLPLFALCTTKLSDDFTVSTGTQYPVIDAGSKEYVSLENGYVIMAKMGKGTVNIQKYDVGAMKEVARNTYEDLPKYAFFQDILKLENRIYYIYEAINKKEGNYTVYSREIDPETATFKEQVALFTTDRKVVPSKVPMGDLTNISGFGLKMAGNKFIVHKSFDDTKVLIRYRLYPLQKDDSKNYDEIGFFVFDNHMKKIWGKEVKMPYTEKQINNIGYAVGSNGEALMLIANREKKTYESFIVNTSGELKTNDIGLSADQYFRKLLIKENKAGNYVCGGLYANGIEFKFNPFTGGAFVFNANGLLYFELDKTGGLVKKKDFIFSKEFIQQNLNDREKDAVEKREKDGKAGVLDLLLRDFVVKEDGSSIFYAERQYIRTEYVGPQQTTVYRFSNAVVIKIDQQGNLVWMKKLPKNQHGVKGAGQMGIAYMEGAFADYVAYIDNPKNIDLSPDDGVPAGHKDGAGGYLTTYKIDHETGKLEKHTIFELTNVNGVSAKQFKPTRVFRVSEGVFMVEAYIGNKKDTMIKIELKK